MECMRSKSVRYFFFQRLSWDSPGLSEKTDAHIRHMASAGGDDARREAARVLAEASERKRTKLNSTGTVVLKAAVVAVLGAQCAQTTQLLFSTATKGTLTVRYAAPEKPTDAQVS